MRSPLVSSDDFTADTARRFPLLLQAYFMPVLLLGTRSDFSAFVEGVVERWHSRNVRRD